MQELTRGWRAIGAGVLVGLLAGCGGGGGGSAPAPAPAPPPAPPTEPNYGPSGPSSSFAQQCAAGNTLATAALRTSSLDTEKRWVRAYMDEAYLWPEDVPKVNPEEAAYSGAEVYASLDNYFGALRSPNTTDSGARRDRYSFTMPTAEWTALTTRGEEPGYGVSWSLGSATPPRRIRVALVEPGSPAAQAGLLRGDELVSVNGTSADVATQAGVVALNAGLFPSEPGKANAFRLRRLGQEYGASMTSQFVAMTPVPLHRVHTAVNGSKVGYLLFNSHILPAEGQLIAAVQALQQQAVNELVLDLRYNGGGYLFIASELAYMIAGRARTDGATFEASRYSSKRIAANSSTPFYSTACLAANGACTAVNQALPTLNLSRVYVLTSDQTCSASEAVINGLRGVNVEVVMVGGQTCGKPYGFTAKDNCGISYFPIEFSSVNAKGFGDYSDGFVPGVGPTARFVPGCRANDDLSRPLGDPAEGQLAAALGHVSSGQCPPSPSPAPEMRKPLSAIDAAPLVPRRDPATQSRIGGIR